jgi:iron complex transport system ATP-binding protein
MSEAVCISNISVQLGNRLILDRITFDVPEGELCVLLGANGSGKTTLLRCIDGLLRPKSGSIQVVGKDVARLSRTEIARLISYVPQSHLPVFSYTVFDTVLAGRSPHVPLSSGPGPSDFEAVHEALKVLGLHSLADRPYTQLSGGERQLTLLARGLAQGVPIMLLDEPTTYLDYHNQHLVLETVSNLVKNYALTALVCLHDPNLALEYGDHLVMLHDGVVHTDLRRDDPGLLAKLERALRIAYRADIRIRTVDGLAFVTGH